MDSVGVAHGRFHASVEKKQNRVMEKLFLKTCLKSKSRRARDSLVCVWVVHLTVTV